MLTHWVWHASHAILHHLGHRIEVWLIVPIHIWIHSRNPNITHLGLPILSSTFELHWVMLAGLCITAINITFGNVLHVNIAVDLFVISNETVGALIASTC